MICARRSVDMLRKTWPRLTSLRAPLAALPSNASFLLGGRVDLGHGTKPPVSSFTTPPNKKDDDLEKAAQLFEEMKKGTAPDTVTFSALIDACAQAKRLDLAFQLFEEMKRKNTLPDSVAFTVLIDACARAERLDLALHCLEEMKRKNSDLAVPYLKKGVKGGHGIAPTVKTYTSVLAALRKKAPVDTALTKKVEDEAKKSDGRKTSGK